MSNLRFEKGTVEDYIKWNGDSVANTPFTQDMRNGDIEYYIVFDNNEYFSEFYVFPKEDNTISLNIVCRFHEMYKEMLSFLKDNYDTVIFESDEEMYDNFRYIKDLVDIIDETNNSFVVSDKSFTINKIKVKIK